MTQVKKELQRIFEFIVKHNNGTINAANKKIRDFIKWAWYYRKLLIIYDNTTTGQRIVGIAIVWRTTEPEFTHEDYSPDATEVGKFLHVYRTIVHPEFEKQGVMFALLALALWRFPGTEALWWESHARGTKGEKIVITSTKLLERLSRGQKRRLTA